MASELSTGWYNAFMKYELAKELKDNGFPQNSSFSFRDCSKYGRSIEIQFSDEATGEYLCDLPELSELIEACGEELEYLKKHINAWEAKGLKTFEDHIPDKHFRTLGETPSEAVAHLWLALNKK